MNKTAAAGEATPATTKTKQNNCTPTDTNSQRLAILAWLLIRPLSTLQAREELGIMHPGGRVMELRRQGYNILTHWVVGYTGAVKHRVAQYVLLAKVTHDE